MEMWPGQPSRTSQELDGLGLSAELRGAGLETSWSNWSGKTLGTETYINTWLIQEQGYPWPLIQYNSAFLVWPAGSEAFFFGLRAVKWFDQIWTIQAAAFPIPSPLVRSMTIKPDGRDIGCRRPTSVRGRPEVTKKLFGKTISVPKGGRLQFWRLTVSKMIWFGGSQSQTRWADLLGFRQALAPISSKLQLVWAEKLGSKPVFPSAFSVASEPDPTSKDSDAKHIHHRNPGLVSPGQLRRWPSSFGQPGEESELEAIGELLMHVLTKDGPNFTFWCVVRGEFSGMIHWLTNNNM